ncbi:hypothetical protein ACFQXA_19620 [Nocardiopsis composta]
MNEVYLKRRGADESAKRRVLFEMRRAAVAAMDAAGVRLLAGTDPQTPGVLPGFGLHQELELMVGAGLTRCAPCRPPPSNRRGSSAASPGRGRWNREKVADLLILDADPLEDIANTTRIHAVVTRGRHIGPAEREALLAEVERAAAGDRV